MHNGHDPERARRALWSLDAGAERAEWVRAAMAAKSAGLTLDDFTAWSETAGNFKSAADCASVWRGIKEDGPIKAGTLYAMARAAGWQDERRAPHHAPQMQRPHQAGQRPAQAPQRPEQGKRPPFDVQAAWEAGEPATAGHPYIVKKQGNAAGLKVYRGPERIAGQALDGALMVPAWDFAGKLQTVQFIPDQGKKLNAPGRPVAGAFVVGKIRPPGTGQSIAITEGIGQAWSCNAAAGMPAVVAFGAGRMEQIARAFQARYPAARLVLIADAGKEEHCAKLAKAMRCAWVEMPAGSPQNFDANDLQQRDGLDALAGLLRDPMTPPARFKLAERTARNLFKGEPPPVPWLVAGIFPLGVSALLASPPNVGKSFLALDLAAKVAGRRSGDLPAVAFGGIVKAHGRAVYVSAEDDQDEVHRRLWSLTKGEGMPDRLHVLSLPDVGHFGIIEPDPVTKEFRPTAAWCDLADEIRALDDVRLVVLDTLQSLTAGDSNTVQATQPLMSEAAALARATGACVLLIHHVAKGKSGDIRTALDAMESIRGSGAISGSARCAYVMWPPADGGRAVCETLGEQYQAGRIAFGIVAKKYGDARRDRTVFVRDEAGVLRDRTEAFNALAGGDTDSMRAELLRAIRAAWEKGEAFAASASGHNGLHGRRFELPESYHEKPRAWFEEQAGKLLADGNVKRLSYRGGARLVPADADTAMPMPEAETAEAETDAPEVAA
ncbi:MAG: putative primase/helicase [Rhodocyclaceae bacterium]|nr:putative primase/helicase [Rhodocyclaceae bacterium]